MYIRLFLHTVLLFILTWAYSPLRAQDKDSTSSKVQNSTETIRDTNDFRPIPLQKKKLKKMNEATKALLMSAIVPGLGQIYNKKWWKVPILYAGGAVLVYFLVENHAGYIEFHNEYEKYYAIHGDNINNAPVDYPSQRTGLRYIRSSALSTERDKYRGARDSFILYTTLLYVVNLLDAYVDGHLKTFDVSPNLSLRFKPGLMQTAIYTAPVVGMKLQLQLK